MNKYYPHRLILKSTIFIFGTLVTASLSYGDLMQYTFEGVATGFQSYHSGLGINDFDVTVGVTKLKYLFQIDFDSNKGTSSNSAGTWYYFHTETISGSIINGMDRPSSYRGFNWVRPADSMGQITGSKLDVRIQTSEFITPNWRVQDWEIGQEFDSIDSGTFSGGSNGSAVYAYGDVKLTAISPIPEPNSVALLFLGTGILYLRRKIFSNQRVESLPGTTPVD